MKVLGLKIVLDDVEPTVWRRIEVPSDIPLDRLHDIIQIVMGWRDIHLHEFVIDGIRYSEFCEDDYEPPEPEGRYRLGDLVKAKGTTFQYHYDFGDSWTHTLTVEKAGTGSKSSGLPVSCTGGQNACPPEDVGGPPGYEDFVEAMKDRNHPEHKAVLEWHGGKFDPRTFDLDAVYLDICRYLRWSRPRTLEWNPR